MSASERILDRIEAAYAGLRTVLAQPVADLVHRHGGPAWHRLSLASFRIAAAALAAEAAGGLAYRIAWAGRRDGAIVWQGLCFLGIALALKACAANARRVSLAASRDPFVVHDPAYRTRPHCALLSALALCCCIDTPHALWRLADLVAGVAASGLPWTHPFVLTALACAVSQLAFPLSFGAGLLFGGCERSRGARKDATGRAGWRGRAHAVAGTGT